MAFAVARLRAGVAGRKQPAAHGAASHREVAASWIKAGADAVRPAGRGVNAPAVDQGGGVPHHHGGDRTISKASGI